MHGPSVVVPHATDASAAFRRSPGFDVPAVFFPLVVVTASSRPDVSLVSVNTPCADSGGSSVHGPSVVIPHGANTSSSFRRPSCFNVPAVFFALVVISTSSKPDVALVPVDALRSYPRRFPCHGSSLVVPHGADAAPALPASSGLNVSGIFFTLISETAASGPDISTIPVNAPGANSRWLSLDRQAFIIPPLPTDAAAAFRSAPRSYAAGVLLSLIVKSPPRESHPAGIFRFTAS